MLVCVPSLRVCLFGERGMRGEGMRGEGMRSEGMCGEGMYGEGDVWWRWVYGEGMYGEEDAWWRCPSLSPCRGQGRSPVGDSGKPATPYFNSKQ